MGVVSILAALGGEIVFLGFLSHRVPVVRSSSSPLRKELVDGNVLPSFQFGLKQLPLSFALPRVESQMLFSFDSPRPDVERRSSELFLHFKQTGQAKKISLPCRIDLQFYEGDKLGFADKESLFWIDLMRIAEGKIQGVVSILNGQKERVETERFILSPTVGPLQLPQEFPENSPFRILGEARFLGHDVFAEKYEGGQTLRIAIGAAPNLQILDLKEKGWIVWKDHQWMNGTLDEKTAFVARIESVDGKALILEGWANGTHVRFSLPATQMASFKMRGEEVFNLIRIRSEKQISCMMDKQCIILRCGDWVLKTGGRWKILRKKEEKEAYKLGKISGELFVFNRIESKQGQKCIEGLLVNAEKTQSVSVDLVANQRNVRKERRQK